MIHRYLSAALAVCSGGLLLAGCSGSTEVSLSGNTPAQYSHVWVTVSGVKFNTSSTAGPDDSGWREFDFSTPTTIDLVSANSGNLSALDTLKVLPGTYSQILLIPVDASTALSSSAQNAGAQFNFEVDYVNSAGTTVQLPLEVLNPDKGISIPTGLKVPIGSVTAALAGAGLASGSNTASGLNSTQTGLGTTTSGTLLGTSGTTTGTTGVGIGSTSSTSSSSSTPANQFDVAVDATSDLVPFVFGTSSALCPKANATTGVPGGCPGMLLSQHASAYDLSKSGGISGQLTLTNITTSTSGLPAIQVDAEVLSADQSRHVVVSTTTVQADGSFQLYPLDASKNGTYYDIVIHGPSIATIIIKSVVVTLPDTSNNNLSGLGNSSTTSTTGTTNSTTNTTASSTSTTSSTSATGTGTANNVVQVGTLTPRAATFYTATLSGTPNLPAGTLIDFMQTLGGKGSVPYVIEENPVDPLNEILVNPQALSVGTIDSGTWAASGTAITLVSAAPLEGAGNYIVSPNQPLYAAGALTQKVSAPSTSSSTTTPTTTFTVLPLALPSGTSQGTLTATVMQATAGSWDQGELLVSNNGTLVAVGSLNSVFANGVGGTISIAVPAGTASSLYYLTVRAWKSAELNPADPTQAVRRQWYDTPIDMRSSTSSSIRLTVN